MANPVPRDADYPIPTVVGRVRYRGYGCTKEVLSDVVRLRVVERATVVVRCRVGAASLVMGNVGVVGSHTLHNKHATLLSLQVLLTPDALFVFVQGPSDPLWLSLDLEPN